MIKLVMVLILGITLLLPAHANAHVLLKDQTAKVGAIVHINPDDDPVAGEKTKIYIDIQDSVAPTRVAREDIRLYVLTNHDEREEVDTKLQGNIIEADYVFRTRGLYQLELVTDSGSAAGSDLRMTYSLRVSRGQGSIVNEEDHGWAEVGLPASVATIVLLLIYGWNNRKTILAKSKFQ